MLTASRILIVEDQEVLGENLKRFLSRGSVDVRLARDALDALEVLKSFTPDVVVLDYGLPDMNGLEAYVEMVRRSARRIGCVMMTAYPRERIAPRANARGIRHVLSKPFGLSELRKLVDLTADEVCRNPPAPIVRGREMRRANERRDLAASRQHETTARAEIGVGAERRRTERRRLVKRRHPG